MKNVIAMELITLFYQHQIKLGYKLKSCKGQQHILLEFLAWLKHQDKNIATSSEEEIKNYYHYLQHRPNRRTKALLSSKTIYSHIKTLEKFYLFTYNQSFIKHNPFTSLILNYPKLENPSRLILSTQEIKVLYQSTANHQERAILSLAYGCGLRAKEIEYLNLSDILFRERLLIIQQGKGYKRRTVPLSKAVLQDLEDYHREERSKQHILRNEQAFLLNARGNRLRAWTLNKRLKTIIERTGKQSLILKQISLHNLRHSIASHLLEQGLSVEQVRVFLGHAYLETTQIYTRVNSSQLKELIAP